ncbi:sugar ABC transporter substrate-binding protein [Lachnospiraceae bacterium ZAX-1]
MKKKMISLALAAAIGVFTLAGCSTTEPGSSDTAKTEDTADTADTADTTDVADTTDTADEGSDEPYKVGFIVQDLTNNYFITVFNGAKEFQSKYGVEVQAVDGHSDAATQVTAIENLVTQGVDCIVICPVDTVAPVGAVKAAQAAGIPVISWSENIEGSDAWLAIDNYQYGYENGKIAGQWILDNLDKQEDAQVMYVYVQENEQLIARGEGMIAGLTELAPNAVTVSTQSGNTTEAGMKAVETVLAKNPDLNVIVCSNDATALGAYEAMIAAGKGDALVCITGQDAEDKVLEYIAKPSIMRGTIDLDSFHQGDLLCESAVKVIKEGKQDEPIFVKFNPVTINNVEEVIAQHAQ